MKVNFEYKGKDLELVYDDETGILSYVIDIKNNEKMMVQYTLSGSGYEMTKDNGYMPMDMCNAVYVRIMALDVFVPKFIFIPNH